MKNGNILHSVRKNIIVNSNIAFHINMYTTYKKNLKYLHYQFSLSTLNRRRYKSISYRIKQG